MTFAPPVGALALSHLDDVPGFGGEVNWAAGIVSGFYDPSAAFDNDTDLSPLTKMDKDAFVELIDNWHPSQEEPYMVEAPLELVIVEKRRTEEDPLRPDPIVDTPTRSVPPPTVLSPVVIPVPAVRQEYEPIETVEAAGVVRPRPGDLDVDGIPVPPPPADGLDSDSDSEMEKMLHVLRGMAERKRTKTRKRAKARKKATARRPVYTTEHARLRALGATESVLASKSSSNALTNKCVECKKTHVSAYHCGLTAHEDSCRKCRVTGKKCSGAALDRRYRKAAGGRWHEFTPKN